MINRCLIASLVCLLGTLVQAQEPTREQAEFFNTRIKPLLEKHCYKCHSHETGKSKGNLVVDSLAALEKGGDTGPAVVRGQPEKSLLMEAVRYQNDELRMPPNGKLPDDQIALLHDWIKQGAPWPGAKKAVASKSVGKITDEDRRYWAFQPLSPAAPPTIKDPIWAKNPVDRFIRARLDAEGLTPSPPAERTALVRRIYADLIGLPPTPAEIDAFVADNAPDAYEKLVDRLLASPRYGEKWARHWLDLVRYAESDGYRIDEFRPQAWRFRDYVIRSFNADKPYDRFVQEQLAGDEMFPDDPDALTATGYLRHWIYEYNQRDVRTQWETVLTDITDVTGEALLGLGMGCARCHDHKFDPILQKDYYRLQAFFASIQPEDYRPLATAQQQKDYYAQLDAWKKQTAEIQARIDALEKPERARAERGAIDKFPPDIQAMMRKPDAQRSPFEKQLAAMAYRQVIYEFDRLDKKFKDDSKAKLLDLRRELSKFDAMKPAPLPLGMTVRDVGPEAPPIVMPKKPKEPIEPGFLTVLDEKPAVIASLDNKATTGRRTTLARWLTRPDQPLTTRVIVNRLWQHHFGQGLVNTPSDFGRLGEKPSHPELLDWLARNFVEEGWSMKKMHRLLVTSQTYRQSATAPPPELAVKKDPQNRFLWRATTRRLQAEQIRDAMLSVTGRLELTDGGPSVDVAQPRRTIYTKAFRNTRDPLLDVFDAPEGVSSVGQRNVTTTPTQALLMINSPFMIQQAQTLATRLRKENPGGNEDLVRSGFRLVFGRTPTQSEMTASLKFLSQQSRRGDPKSGGSTFQFARMPYRESRAALMQPGSTQPMLEVPAHAKLPTSDFTFEAFIVLRSVFDDGKVRPIASHGVADKGPGWLFGVTSKKSAHKPQMLVLQMWGESADGKKDYEPVFSSVHIDLNKPYYVAVSVKLDDQGKTGITFFAKDLSDDEELLHADHVTHRVVKMAADRGPLILGGCRGNTVRSWDGLLDDVRLSRVPLREQELLINTDNLTDRTVAFWQFESTPGAYKDSSPTGLDIARQTTTEVRRDDGQAALVDFCHVLLNANEFLYID